MLSPFLVVWATTRSLFHRVKLYETIHGILEALSEKDAHTYVILGKYCVFSLDIQLWMVRVLDKGQRRLAR